MGVDVRLQMRSADMVEVHFSLFELNQGIHTLCKQLPVRAVFAVKSKMVYRRIDERIVQNISGIYFLEIWKTIGAQGFLLLTEQKLKSSQDD